MSKGLSVVFAGLSGQGIVMVGRVITTALLADGQPVILSDNVAITHKNAPTHTQLRIGEDAHASTIADGEADLVVAFEATEGLKVGLTYASDDGLVILNDNFLKQGGAFRDKLSETDPMDDVIYYLGKAGIKNVKVFPGTDVCHDEVGRLITLNMVMLGAAVATGMMPVKPESVENAISSLTPGNAIEVNLKAFRAGMKNFKEQLDKERVKTAA